MISADAVLAQFDEAAENAFFPDPDNGYYYPVDARMRLFRDEMRWALVVELVGYNPRGWNLYDVLHFFGNCLTSGDPGFDHGDFLERIDNFDQLVDEQGEEYAGGVPLLIRGRPVHVEAEPGTPFQDVCRMLVPAHRDLLLADETELRARTPAGLPEILCLDEWRYPSLPDESPSASETYRQLAEVLATGDTTRYRPTLPPNTHWSHWPAAGTL